MILEDDLLCFGACAAEGALLTSYSVGYAFCYGLCPGEARRSRAQGRSPGHGTAAMDKIPSHHSTTAVQGSRGEIKTIFPFLRPFLWQHPEPAREGGKPPETRGYLRSLLATMRYN